MMGWRALISFLVFVLSGSTAAAKSVPGGTAAGYGDGACIRWDAGSHPQINKRQADRLYWEATRWENQ